MGVPEPPSDFVGLWYCRGWASFLGGLVFRLLNLMYMSVTVATLCPNASAMVSVSMDFPFSGNLKEGIDYAMWLTREWIQKQKHKKIGCESD